MDFFVTEILILMVFGFFVTEILILRDLGFFCYRNFNFKGFWIFDVTEILSLGQNPEFCSGRKSKILPLSQNPEFRPRTKIQNFVPRSKSRIPTPGQNSKFEVHYKKIKSHSKYQK